MLRTESMYYNYTMYGKSLSGYLQFCQTLLYWFGPVVAWVMIILYITSQMIAYQCVLEEISYHQISPTYYIRLFNGTAYAVADKSHSLKFSAIVNCGKHGLISDRCAGPVGEIVNCWFDLYEAEFVFYNRSGMAALLIIPVVLPWIAALVYGVFAAAYYRYQRYVLKRRLALTKEN